MNLIMGTIGFLGAFFISAQLYSEYSQTKQPEILDSMLCEKHVPTGTMLVTDRVIKCTNGKRYEVIE